MDDACELHEMCVCVCVGEEDHGPFHLSFFVGLFPSKPFILFLFLVLYSQISSRIEKIGQEFGGVGLNGCTGRGGCYLLPLYIVFFFGGGEAGTG